MPLHGAVLSLALPPESARLSLAEQAMSVDGAGESAFATSQGLWLAIQ